MIRIVEAFDRGANTTKDEHHLDHFCRKANDMASLRKVSCVSCVTWPGKQISKLA